MAKAKKQLAFATFVTSGLAMIASFVALGTQHWTSADVVINQKYGNVHYGLFYGLYTRKVGPEIGITYELSMTCLMSENVCAMLCDSTPEARTSVLTRLFNNQNPTFGCLNVRRSPAYEVPNLPRGDTYHRDFMNAGLWVATVLFLALSCFAGLVSTVLAMWNTIYNPSMVYFNLTGSFVWNCVGCACSLLAIAMWGIMFATILIRNVCVFDTIKNQAITGNAFLHYSYWLNLVAFLLYIISMILNRIAARSELKSEEYNSVPSG